MAQKFHRRREVASLHGLALSSLADRVKRGLFPRPDVKLGPQLVGWSDDLIGVYQNALLRYGADHPADKAAELATSAAMEFVADRAKAFEAKAA